MIFAFAFVLSQISSPAWAHKPSDGFLAIDIEGTTVSGQLDIAIKDLEMLMAIDTNQDLKVTWGELRSRQDEIFRYATDHVRINSNAGACALDLIDLEVTNYSDGAYATVLFETSCVTEPIKTLDVTYEVLFDLDAQHRGLMNLSYREEFSTFVFTSQSHTYRFEALGGGTGDQIMLFVKEGLHHIFRGYDHMLFLIALVLPAIILSLLVRLNLISRRFCAFARMGQLYTANVGSPSRYLVQNPSLVSENYQNRDTRLFFLFFLLFVIFSIQIANRKLIEPMARSELSLNRRSWRSTDVDV